MTETASLDSRIALAFGDGVTSARVAELIREAEAASTRAAEEAQRARRTALDPRLSPEHALAARRASEDAGFRDERLRTAVGSLRGRLAEVRAEEEDARRRAAYEQAKAERDSLAAELRDFYPPLVARMSDLLRRITENDRLVEFINGHALPADAKRLLVAELVARGLDGFVGHLSDTPRITRDARLPAFERDVHRPFAWPAT